MTMAEEKQALRRRMKVQRAGLSDGERQKFDKAICRQLLELPQIRQAETVYAYASYGSEADTWRLVRALLQRRILVALPRVEGREMVFYRIEAVEQLAAGYRGILEPGMSCAVAKDPLAPVITPGLAFDRTGGRLGYGGGYYDRFFAAEPEHPRIAAAYPFQVVEAVPGTGLDLPVEWIVTGEEVIWCKEESHGISGNRQTGKSGCQIFK